MYRLKGLKIKLSLCYCVFHCLDRAGYRATVQALGLSLSSLQIFHNAKDSNKRFSFLPVSVFKIMCTVCKTETVLVLLIFSVRLSAVHSSSYFHTFYLCCVSHDKNKKQSFGSGGKAQTRNFEAQGFNFVKVAFQGDGS